MPRKTSEMLAAGKSVTYHGRPLWLELFWFGCKIGFGLVIFAAIVGWIVVLGGVLN